MYYQVLLVDDEEIVCKGLRQFLDWESYGYHVADVAHSVDQALVCLEKSPIDLVITDIRMPVRDGLELLAAIQEEYPDIITIVLSGYGEFEYARQALRHGASEFLTKPVNFGELKRLLASLRSKLELERIEVSERREYKQMKINLLLNNLANGQLNARIVEAASLLEPYLSNREYCVIRLHLPGSSVPHEAVEVLKSYWMQGANPPSESYSGAVFPFNNELDELSFLIFPDSAPPSAERFIDGLQAQLRQLQLKGIVGGSDYHAGLEQIHDAYREAGKALQFLFISGQQSVMYGQIEAWPFLDDQLDEAFSLDVLRRLSSLQQRESLAAYISGTLDAMAARGSLSAAEAQAFCIQVALIINQHLHSIRDSKQVGDTDFQSLIRCLLLAQQLSGIKKVMHDWLTRLTSGMGENESESGSVITNIKRYIQEHYAENITLNSLSGIFYLHPIYLSRLFKEKSGLNFVEYITEVRMGMAKELLLNPTLRVHDICQMVGYESPRHFTKLFKNATGMTPKSYRETGGAKAFTE
ncbi:MAG: response regulator [Paenibacillaceae bacterium]|jgi:YesN/AraC family two-component response regulator|nr:response regulator [Paenibacillaceae bacterium]